MPFRIPDILKQLNRTKNVTKEDFFFAVDSADINHVKDIDGDKFKIAIQKGSIYNLELADSIINLKRKKNEAKIEGLLRTKGKFNFSQINKISTLFALNTSNFKDINGTGDLKTNINFDLSKKLQGKSKSYKWAVRCLQINNCWIRYMGGSRTESMINKFAKIYSNKWSDLLKDSLQGESLKVRGNEWLVVPTDRLVQYLIAAGEYDKAAEVTEVMVSSIEQETAHLALEPCYWTEEPVKFDAIAYNLLLQNFFLPDSAIRLKTAKEIAKTLTFKNAKYYKKLYLKYLSELSFETEISDFLSILLSSFKPSLKDFDC